jgi:tetratricopeptide (TPR) repeat protein
MFQSHCIWAASLLAAPLIAQMEPTATIKGRLSGGDETMLNTYVIEITNLSTRAIFDRIDVSFNGDFSVRGVPLGDYLARVTTYQGDLVAQQFVSVNQSITPVDVKLPGRPVTPSGRTVSVRELRNPVRRQAVEASLTAQRLSASGKFERAAVELEKAVKISPDYAAAHSNLGAQYLRLGRCVEAEAEIRRALEIAGPNPQDLSNLAYAELMQERFDEAGQTARSALKLRKDMPTPHFVLGLTLVLQPETRGEGVAHLEEAAKSMDAARRALAALGQ